MPNITLDGDYMLVGENVRKLRLKKDLSLQELSELSGISKSMLSEVENDKKTPSIETALRIAEALNVTLSNLLGEEPQYYKTSALYVNKKDRQILHDPTTGVKRFFISPPLNSRGIDFVFGIAPPDSTEVILAPSLLPTTKYIYVVQGILNYHLNNTVFKLMDGDSLCYEANVEQKFSSEGPEECHYYVVIHQHN